MTSQAGNTIKKEISYMKLTEIKIHERLARRQTAVAVIGVGYVGLPVALTFSHHFNVIGYDIDESRIEKLCNIYCRHGESLRFDASENALDDASFYIVTVPTPVDDAKKPDLSPVIHAIETIARHLKPGDFVVFESSVYPGCTDNLCIPMLERLSGLTNGKDFKTGYSPERINPADRLHTFANTPKLVSANDASALVEIAKVYQTVIDAEIHCASSIIVAETAKMMENAQRNVNIALMNELSKLCKGLGIDMGEVVNAASSKWNFMPFRPGLVGGHCIPVDPHYLIDCGNNMGIDMPVLKSCCEANDDMARYVVDSLLDIVRESGKDPGSVRALLMGFTYKANIDDTRNTMSAPIYRLLTEASVKVDVTDSHADAGKVLRDYGIGLTGIHGSASYDIIIVAVAHAEYAMLDEKYFRSIAKSDALLADLTWMYKDKIHNLAYWSL